MVIEFAVLFPGVYDSKGVAAGKRFLTLPEEVLKIYFSLFLAQGQ